MIRDSACMDAARRIVVAIQPAADHEMIELAASIIKIAALQDERAQLEGLSGEVKPPFTVIEGGKPA